MITAKAGNSHEILLPVEAADIFISNLSSYEQPLVTWQTYHAKRGEKVEKIAKKFGISTAEFRSVNSLHDSKALTENRLVLVPANHAKPDQSFVLDKNRIELLNTSHRTELNAKQAIRHEVAANETLYAIALRYGVTVKQIMENNQLKNSRLKVGQVLVIPPGGRTSIQKQAESKNSTFIALANH